MESRKRFAPACERNREPILDILKQVLPASGALLEVGSGTGQHAAWFAPEFPQLLWQPTDLEENLPGIDAWCSEVETNNVAPAFELNLETFDWPEKQYDVVVCINTIHIIAWALVEKLFAGVGKSLKPGGLLYVYGPYRYRNKPLEPSNENFDIWLKQRDPASGIREFEKVNELAIASGLEFAADRPMPANNRSIWWSKTG